MAPGEPGKPHQCGSWSAWTGDLYLPAWPYWSVSLTTLPPMRSLLLPGTC